jgi:hypothetical protein
MGLTVVMGSDASNVPGAGERIGAGVVFGAHTFALGT